LSAQSGLKGMTGHAGDLREIVPLYGTDEVATLALDMYVARVVESIGAYIAQLNGVHAVVFTAAVGEGSSKIRSLICDYFRYIGLELDASLNELNVEKKEIAQISSKSSQIPVWVVPANEELEIIKLWTSAQKV
jgi:acetate kinase